MAKASKSRKNHVRVVKDEKVKLEEPEIVPHRRINGQEAYQQFREAVWTACMRVPHGRVTTYAHIARLVGFPNHSRSVGRVLKEGGWQENDVPWQRIINSSGKISLRSNRGQVNVQAQLLQQEGIQVTSVAYQHSISLNRYGWFEL
jgi:methylated-DNA-protein-cysteine methyltransferase-like protein